MIYSVWHPLSYAPTSMSIASLWLYLLQVKVASPAYIFSVVADRVLSPTQKLPGIQLPAHIIISGIRVQIFFSWWRWAPVPQLITQESPGIPGWHTGQAIQFSSNSWSSYTRWIIYTTFIRPKFEYAAPLFKCFTLALKSVALYRPMVAAERSAISWVLRCTGRTPNVDAGILGCYPIAQRFSHLRTMFQLHRLQLRQENPLVIVLKSPLGMKSANMIRYLDSDPVYDEFTLLNPTIPLMFQKPVLREFLLSRRKQYLQTKATTILKYIDPKSRRPSLLDCTLLAPTEYQQDFISWRRGKWLMGHKCICGKPWNRSHVEHFGTTESLVPGGLYGKYRRTQCNYPRHYTIIDFLLNHKEFKIAFALLQNWKKRMYTATVAWFSWILVLCSVWFFFVHDFCDYRLHFPFGWTLAIKMCWVGDLLFGDPFSLVIWLEGMVGTLMMFICYVFDMMSLMLCLWCYVFDVHR
jgi:hypothetical protein